MDNGVAMVNDQHFWEIDSVGNKIDKLPIYWKAGNFKNQWATFWPKINGSLVGQTSGYPMICFF